MMRPASRWRFSMNKPPVLLGGGKRTLVNKNLGVIIVKVWRPHH